MIFYVDIDETICTLGENSMTKETRDYNYAVPRPKQIDKINKGGFTIGRKEIAS